MKTTPTKNLLSLRHQPYAVSCATCHPDNNRVVILFEGPNANGLNKAFVVAARYKDGEYYGEATGAVIPINSKITVWMESPMSEGPFLVANYTEKRIVDNRSINTKFTNIQEASKYVNDLNTMSMGMPTYTVVDENGILIDHEGFYTKHAIGMNRIGQRYAETIDDTKKCINLDFGDKS